MRAGRLTALVSFLLGTLILACYFFTDDDNALFAGYLYIGIATLFNLIVFFILLFGANANNPNRIRYLKTAGLMTLNIPVAIAYIWIVLELLNIMRITFVNSTDRVLTNVDVVGCGGGYIDRLGVGESTTLWVYITGNCALFLEYEYNGTLRQETVASYLTPLMGARFEHVIDGQDKDYPR